MRRWLGIAGLILLVVVAFAAGMVRLPYLALGPGPIREVSPLIHVDGPTVYPSSGRLVMTTVRFRHVTAVGAFLTWLDPDETLVDEDVLYPPGVSPAEEERRAISDMDQSKIAAAVVALSHVTTYPRSHGRGALIEQVGEGCPADGVLYPGDLIRRIDDERVRSAGEARDLIDGVPVGEPIAFRVEADGEVHTASVQRGRCPGIDEPLVGITIVQPFPFEVSIESGDVGGPSAGLMWALGLYEVLTPGDLTDGRTIAGTGSIDADGNIGPIGGILDKVAAAREAGADILLIPEANEDELAAVDRGDVRVIPVATFDEALRALGASEPTS
jgi:PDZ domain-containing protein